MIEDGVDAPPSDVGTAISGRRRALQALTATVLGLIGIEAGAAKKNKNKSHGGNNHQNESRAEKKGKSKSKPGPTGPTGPTGPAGGGPAPALPVQPVRKAAWGIRDRLVPKGTPATPAARERLARPDQKAPRDRRGTRARSQW